MANDSKLEAWKAVRSVLVVQAVVSAAIAILLIGGTVYLAASAKDPKAAFNALEILKNWGGVIIGFYFGTAYTQIATLVRAIEGSPKPESKEGPN